MKINGPDNVDNKKGSIL